MACMVLRCGNTSAATINVAGPDRPTIQAPVCAQHDAAIRDGEDYRYRDFDRVILMGADIRAAGLQLVTKIVHLEEEAGDSRLNAGVLRVEYSDGTQGDLYFTMSALASIKQIPGL